MSSSVPSLAADVGLNAADLFSVRGKVALVTGGGTGLGKVYITSRKKEVCDTVAAELSSIGPGSCHSLPKNLSSKKSCEEVAAEFGKLESKLHILVNNSGLAGGAPMEDFPEAMWKKILTLNVEAVFNLTVALLPFLRNATTGNLDPARVINVGSIAVSYGTSKAAVAHLSRMMAAKLAPEAITVNCIAPGVFPTNMSRWFFQNDELNKALVQTIPLGRVGLESDIGGLALLLASKAGAFMTGTIIPIDGGALLQSKI